MLRVAMPVVAVGVALVVAPLDLVLPWVAPLPGSVQEQVEEALSQGLDGVIVYVDEAGKAPRFHAAGWKDKAAREPADPHALFRIASISKLYIAAAVARLAGQGRVSLDESLAEYLPDLAGRIAHADRITLRMMMQHRSGIPNFTEDEAWDWFAAQTSPDEALALVLDEPSDFEPGTRSRYSNTNYLLIGRVLDGVLGYSHRQYIAEELLKPLGLSHTYGLLSQAPGDDLASGYWYGEDDDLKTLDHVIPGGSMVATAQDVGVFVRALNDGSLLEADEQAIYTSLYPYGHEGWVPGYHSIARYHEDIDAVVVQFVNTTGGDTWGTANIVGGKATALSSILYDRIVRILRRR